MTDNIAASVASLTLLLLGPSLQCSVTVMNKSLTVYSHFEPGLYLGHDRSI